MAIAGAIHGEVSYKDAGIHIWHFIDVTLPI
jgi:hypothetical protein